MTTTPQNYTREGQRVLLITAGICIWLPPIALAILYHLLLQERGLSAGYALAKVTIIAVLTEAVGIFFLVVYGAWVKPRQTNSPSYETFQLHCLGAMVAAVGFTIYIAGLFSSSP